MVANPGELRELHDDELDTRLREAKQELFNLRFQMATGQLDNNRQLRTVKHDIARIYTILRERELGLSIAPEDITAGDGESASDSTAESEIKEGASA
jgi:large subunit ribosomal protein L29